MKTKKRILILGGGYYNLPLIQKSVDLGYYTIVLGISGDYPGYKVATEWINVDVFDKEAVLEIANEKQVDAVLATGSDGVMATIGYVNDRMHLIGPSEFTTTLSTNKFEMKKRFISTGVRTAEYQQIRTLKEAMHFAEVNEYPVVLKVVDACGGKGIAIVRNQEDLSSVFYAIWKDTKQNYLIIEKYIKGEEFGAQAYVKNNDIKFIMPHGDMVYHSLTDVPIGHYAPYEHTEDLKEDIREQLELCIKALEIKDAAINADFILNEGKVYVLEIGVRPGATCLPELVTEHYGKNYYEYLLHSALGEKTDENFEPKSATIVETLISTKTGIVKDVYIGALPKEVVSYSVYPKIGDCVHSFRTAYDRIGTLVLRGECVDALKNVREEILGKDIVLNIDEQ